MYGEGVQKVGNYLSTSKTKVKIAPVVKLCHAKVVVSSRRHSRKKPVTCIRPGIASTGGSFLLEDSMEKYRRCGGRALFLWCKSPLVSWSLAVDNWKSGRLGT